MVSTVGSRSPNFVCKRVKRPDAEGRAWYIRGLDKRAHTQANEPYQYG